MMILVTGCQKGTEETKKEAQKPKTEEETIKTIELVDEKLAYQTTFTYPAEEKFSNIEYYDEGASKEITFKNEELDLNFQMYYTSMTIESYKNSEEARSHQKYYKKYKFGKYEAYAYSNYESSLNMNILLKETDSKMAQVLFVSMERIDAKEEVVVADVVDSKKLQDFYNSIKFTSINR